MRDRLSASSTRCSGQCSATSTSSIRSPTSAFGWGCPRWRSGARRWRTGLRRRMPFERTILRGFVHRELVVHRVHALHRRHGRQEPVDLMLQHVAAQTHASLGRFHVDRTGVCHQAAQLSPDALAQLRIAVGSRGAGELRARVGHPTLQSIAQSLALCIGEIAQVVRRLDELVADHRTPPASHLRVQVVHRGSPCGDSEEGRRQISHHRSPFRSFTGGRGRPVAGSSTPTAATDVPGHSGVKMGRRRARMRTNAGVVQW